ncbi:MAG: helix-turn-helix domain-containing protein [Methylobacteriaceae bacterium]|nr:helix-turn-helix domain-containing protein [Methylobacteriaceae bacterium]MBV9245729.1 helix-turn-helix domain-containing protein [Methylobacteriaceae bacterium]
MDRVRRSKSATHTDRRTVDGKARQGRGLATGSKAPAAKRRSLEQAIGTHVRSLRRRLELTATELAAKANISVGMLSKIEHGLISPSLFTLQSLASALGAPLAAFFAAFEEVRDSSFVKAGRGVTIERRGTKAGHQYQLLGHSLASDVIVEPYLITLSQEAQPYTAFQHEGVEFIYMLSGKVIYRHSDRTFLLEPGDALFFDAGGVHGPEELIEKPMTYLSIIIYQRK